MAERVLLPDGLVSKAKRPSESFTTSKARSLSQNVTNQNEFAVASPVD